MPAPLHPIMTARYAPPSQTRVGMPGSGAPDGSALAIPDCLIGADGVGAMAIDAAGDAYVIGLTVAGFPSTGVAAPLLRPQLKDEYVVHLDANGGLPDVASWLRTLR